MINPILVISTRLNARQKLRLMQQQAQANAETLSPPTDLPATVRQSPTLEPNRRPNMAALIRIAPLIVPFCIDELPLSLVSPYSYFEEPNKCEDGQEFSLEHKCVVSYLRSIWDSILFSLREVHAVIQGVLKEGILTFWSGIFLAYILTINPAIQKSIFDYLTLLIYGREADGRIPTKEDLSYWNLFFISSTSKTAATITTYPLTLLKSRLYISIQSTQEEIKDKQASSLLASNQSVDPQESEKLNGNNLIVTKPLPTQQQGTTSRNMWTEFLEVLKTDGPAGLYRGLFSKIIQNCIMSVLNDFFSKSILRKLKILYPFAEADDHDLESEDLSSASGSIKKSQERPRKGSYKDFNGRGKHGFLRRSHGAVMPEEFSERPEDILEKSVVYRKNQQHLLRSALGSL